MPLFKKKPKPTKNGSGVSPRARCSGSPGTPHRPTGEHFSWKFPLEISLHLFPHFHPFPCLYHSRTKNATFPTWSGQGPAWLCFGDLFMVLPHLLTTSTFLPPNPPHPNSTFANSALPTALPFPSPPPCQASYHGKDATGMSDRLCLFVLRRFSTRPVIPLSRCHYSS